MMNIWVVASSYESQLFASTHFTRKGAYLAAVSELYECMNINGYETMDDFWEDYGLGEDDEKPEWCSHEMDSLRALSADDLQAQFFDMWEIYWENHDGYGDRVELEIIHTKVTA